MWLRSAAKFAEEDAERLRSLPTAGRHGGKGAANEVCKTLERYIVRRRLTQGLPYKRPLIRELLWDWFVDIRRSLGTRSSPKFVLMKAKAIAKEVLSQQRAEGKFEALPVLDRGWPSRFKKDKGIVWRRPNVRFKCSRVVLLGRLRATLLTCTRVRRLAEHTLGHDLSEATYGIDERPLHFNEAGSKCIRTLEIAGAPAVRLKENHAATRERCSLMTMVTSDRRAASSPANVPIELTFKAKSSRRHMPASVEAKKSFMQTAPFIALPSPVVGRHLAS